jgi:5-methylcytosine-specific restriction endonuclease McrA
LRRPARRPFLIAAIYHAELLDSLGALVHAALMQNHFRRLAFVVGYKRDLRINHLEEIVAIAIRINLKCCLPSGLLEQMVILVRNRQGEIRRKARTSQRSRQTTSDRPSLPYAPKATPLFRRAQWLPASSQSLAEPIRLYCSEAFDSASVFDHLVSIRRMHYQTEGVAVFKRRDHVLRRTRRKNFAPKSRWRARPRKRELSCG